MKLQKSFIIAATALFMAVAAKAQTSFTAENLSGAQGATINLPVCMNNAGLEAVSFDVNIALPEGVTIALDSKGKPAVQLSDRKDDHVITAGQISDGSYNIVSYSGNNYAYDGESGVIFTCPIVLDAEPGEYVITISKGTVTAKTGVGTLVGNACETTTATLTITEAEAPVVIEDFQFYTKNVVGNSGNLISVDVYFNAKAAVSNYSCDIVLPKGIKVFFNEDSEYNDWQIDLNEDLNIPLNFTCNNDYDESTNTISLTSKTKKSATYPAGDAIHLTMLLEPAESAAGYFPIVFKNQSVTSNGTEYTPSDFTSTIKLNGTENITLNVNDSKWATLILPYGAETPNGLTAYTATGAAGGVVNLEEQGSIPAMTPVIIYGTKGTYKFSGNNSAAKKAQYKSGVLTGTLVDATFPTGDYIMQTQSGRTAFYQLAADRLIHAYRCVLSVPAGVSYAPRLELGDTATGINSCSFFGGNSAIYTLDGKKVDAMKRGNIYIVNGTKVMVK